MKYLGVFVGVLDPCDHHMGEGLHFTCVQVLVSESPCNNGAS